MKIKILLLLATIALLSACDSERYYFLWRYLDSDQYTFDGFFKVPETEYFARLVDTTEFTFKYLYLSKDSLLLRNNVHDADVICIKMTKLCDYLSFVEFHGDVIVIDDCYMSVINDRQNICRLKPWKSEKPEALILNPHNNSTRSGILEKEGYVQINPSQDFNWIYTDTQTLSESLDKRKDPRNKLLRYIYRHMIICQFISGRLGDWQTEADLIESDIVVNGHLYESRTKIRQSDLINIP